MMLRTAVRPAAIISRLSAPLRSLTSSSANRPTVSAAVKQDHRDLERYYENIQAAEDADTKVRWQNQFIWELAVHSIAEELVVYPALEHYLKPEYGRALAAKDRTQHADLKVLLKEFQKMYPSDPDFRATLESLYAELKLHVNDEEKNDLVALEKAIPTREESRDIARSFERTKYFVPTRSHPLAPDKPPFETVVGLMAAPIDRLRDVFERFPKKETPGKRPETEG